MRQTYDERELLKQIADVREDLQEFRRGTISHLIHDLDAIEQEVKSVGAAGKNTKAVYKRCHTKLQEIKTKIMHLHARRGARIFRGARVIAVFFALLFLFLYILAGFNHKTMPTTISDAVVWGGIGIVVSAINYMNFMLLFHVFVSLAIRLPGKYNPGKPTLLERLFSSVIFYLLAYTYFNTYALLFSFTQSWAYPYLRILINGILQGEIIPRIYAFLTVISTIVGLIGGALSIIDFLKKRWKNSRTIP